MVSRRKRDGSRAEVMCPSAIATYTRNMGGVDKGDQLRKYYSVRLKCTKNYKYVFWFLFDVSITNAYILSGYVPSTPTSLDQGKLKNFRVRLAKALVGNYNSCQKGRRSIPVSAAVRPSNLPDLHRPSYHPRKRCKYCRGYRTPPRRRESVWQCMVCKGEPTLCLTGKDDGSDCWYLWHRDEQH